MADAAASVVIHFGYYLTLAEAYRTGDLSFAYPLMRGTAPLLVTLLGVVFLRELPSPNIAFGILPHLLGASSPSHSRSGTIIRARRCTGRSATRPSSASIR
jgi:drug/metabolite transporter (DMT)-like permease